MVGAVIERNQRRYLVAGNLTVPALNVWRQPAYVVAKAILPEDLCSFSVAELFAWPQRDRSAAATGTVTGKLVACQGDVHTVRVIQEDRSAMGLR